MITAFLLHHWFLICIASQFLVGYAEMYSLELNNYVTRLTS